MFILGRTPVAGLEIAALVMLGTKPGRTLPARDMYLLL